MAQGGKLCRCKSQLCLPCSRCRCHTAARCGSGCHAAATHHLTQPRSSQLCMPWSQRPFLYTYAPFPLPPPPQTTNMKDVKRMLKGAFPGQDVYDAHKAAVKKHVGG